MQCNACMCVCICMCIYKYVCMYVCNMHISSLGGLTDWPMFFPPKASKDSAHRGRLAGDVLLRHPILRATRPDFSPGATGASTPRRCWARTPVVVPSPAAVPAAVPPSPWGCCVRQGWGTWTDRFEFGFGVHEAIAEGALSEFGFGFVHVENPWGNQFGNDLQMVFFLKIYGSLPYRVTHQNKCKSQVRVK